MLTQAQVWFSVTQFYLPNKDACVCVCYFSWRLYCPLHGLVSQRNVIQTLIFCFLKIVHKSMGPNFWYFRSNSWPTMKKCSQHGFQSTWLSRPEEFQKNCKGFPFFPLLHSRDDNKLSLGKFRRGIGLLEHCSPQFTTLFPSARAAGWASNGEIVSLDFIGLE